MQLLQCSYSSQRASWSCLVVRIFIATSTLYGQSYIEQILPSTGGSACFTKLKTQQQLRWCDCVIHEVLKSTVILTYLTTSSRMLSLFLFHSRPS